MRQQLSAFDAGAFSIAPQLGRASARASEIAREESVNRDSSRKLALVGAPTFIEKCRSMVKAAV
jgi:hypothetical protein